MKTYKFFAIAMAAVATASCTKEIAQTNAPEENLNLSPLTLTACYAEEDTKAAFSENEYPVIEWKGDAISILGTATGNQKFTTTSNSKTAAFTGLADLTDDTLYAVYPYNGNISLNDDGTTLANVKIPEIQTATAGSFDPKAYVAVAKCTDKATLNFKALGSFLKFQVADAKKVKSVTFIGNNNENMAGSANKVTVVDKPEHGGLSTSSPFVRVQGTFEAEKNYFAIIRPMTYSKGITICVEYWNDPADPEKGTTIKYCSTSAKISAARNRIMKLGSAPLAPTKDVTEDLYACYIIGKNVDIAGTKVNRTSYPGGVLVTENKEIKNGVFFINDGITATLKTAGKTIAINRYAGKTSTVARTDSYVRVTATAEGDYLLMKNIILNLAHSDKQKYMMSLSADDAFEQIIFDGCKISFPTGKTILLSAAKGKILNQIKFNNCDIKLTDAGCNIINYASNKDKGTENSSTVESLFFKNNIVYSSSDITSFKIFYGKWASINNLTVTNNTFYNTYCNDEGYVITKQCSNLELRYNVFSMPNYNTYAKNGWWGFLRCNGTGGNNDGLTYYPKEGNAKASNNLSYQIEGNTFKVSHTDMKNGSDYYAGVSNPIKINTSPFKTEDVSTPKFILKSDYSTTYRGATR